jgi:hypothetical protein
MKRPWVKSCSWLELRHDDTTEIYVRQLAVLAIAAPLYMAAFSASLRIAYKLSVFRNAAVLCQAIGRTLARLPPSSAIAEVALGRA